MCRLVDPDIHHLLYSLVVTRNLAQELLPHGLHELATESDDLLCHLALQRSIRRHSCSVLSHALLLQRRLQAPNLAKLLLQFVDEELQILCHASNLCHSLSITAHVLHRALKLAPKFLILSCELTVLFTSPFGLLELLPDAAQFASQLLALADGSLVLLLDLIESLCRRLPEAISKFLVLRNDGAETALGLAGTASAARFPASSGRRF
mmetsp:Transcript_44439/g.96625  ORF Transcript_44439/g.96625 Transcript_44439/m.96625 type:complete len:208 (-) Transcript_44439:844-1467(-)